MNPNLELNLNYLYHFYTKTNKLSKNKQEEKNQQIKEIFEVIETKEKFVTIQNPNTYIQKNFPLRKKEELTKQIIIQEINKEHHETFLDVYLSNELNIFFYSANFKPRSRFPFFIRNPTYDKQEKFIIELNEILKTDYPLFFKLNDKPHAFKRISEFGKEYASTELLIQKFPKYKI